MKSRIGVAVVLGLLAGAVAAHATNAPGTCISPTMISFNGGDVFAYETIYNNATYSSSAGSQLTVVGKIVCFGPPLDYLNSTWGTYEYTFILTGLVSQGTVPTNPLATLFKWDTSYNPGTFAIYQDAAMDAPSSATIAGFGPPPNAAVPSTFINGHLLLSGTVDYFHTQIVQNNGSWSGSFNALYTSTGGDPAVFASVGNGQANLNGLWCSLGTGPGQCAIGPGYSAHPSGKFDAPSTITATLNSTWGRIKTIYR